MERKCENACFSLVSLSDQSTTDSVIKVTTTTWLDLKVDTDISSFYQWVIFMWNREHAHSLKWLWDQIEMQTRATNGPSEVYSYGKHQILLSVAEHIAYS